MARTPAPPISDKLIEWLEGVFPDTLPASVPDEAQLGRLIGRQDVIRKLRSEIQRSREKALEGGLNV